MRKSKIESIDEEPENSEITSSSRAGLAIASMVNDEVGDLLAVMRGNVIWGGDQLEPSLIQSLKALRKRIFSWQHHWHTIDPVLYLSPFLDVIRSGEMEATVTYAALSSVYKILTSDALDLSSVSIEGATHMVVDSVSGCRFEVTDPSSEEFVLMKVLQILLRCMKGKTFVALSNIHVCTIVNTCFRIFHQAGELLHRVARDTIHELIRRIFAHLTKNEVVIFDKDRSFSSDNHQSSEAFDSAEPSSSPCMVEIFQFLCSLLNVVEHENMGPSANSVAFDENVPLFTLDLINSAIGLSGPTIRHHPRLLSLVQDELFCCLMEFGLSMSPLILSKVCSIVFNLYLHLRVELKLQIEAFFSCVIMRLSQSRYGASYQQQEAVMEVLVNFCRQKDFAVEIYANFDCDITCTNLFEELTKLLCKSAFPVNAPLSALHILALDGLVALVQNMAERIGNGPSCSSESGPVILEEYTPYWMLRCEDFNDWIPFVRRQKLIKKRLMIAADHFNRDPKKGLEFLQGSHLLLPKLNPRSVACFFKYAAGLNKNIVGEFIGNHDDFCVQVLREFVRTIDFREMSLDTALRLFLETFRLPGESQKIQRVLEAFSERYYEQSPLILANKDAALVLSYSIIMLNTDQHNVQVKNKMSEEDFIRNNRNINDGNNLPREFLSEIYFSICRNEIQTTTPDQWPGIAEMTPSRWIDLMNRSKNTTQYIVPDSRPCLNHEMFALISGPSVAALSAVFDSAEHEEVCQTCIDGFLAVAEISACNDLKDILDDLITSLCKSTTLLNPSFYEEPIPAFGDNAKAHMATVAVFTIAKRYGDFICNGWRYILGCILRLHKLGLLPELRQEKPLTNSSSIAKEPLSEPSKRTLQMIQECRIDSIFMESEFLEAESLLQLARALMKGSSSPEDEDSAVFCLELLIAVVLNNRDRIGLLWQGIYDHISNIIQSSVMPCAVVENAVLELLRICQKLLPYKYNLADEMLRPVHMIRKLSP